MKKSYKYIMASFLVLAFSCQKEVEKPVESASEPIMRTFICTIGDSGDDDTKVAIAANGKTTWEAGDEILIHGEYVGTSDGKKYSEIVTLTAGDIFNDGKSARITVATDPDGLTGIKPYVRADYSSTLYAAYPASAVKSGNYHTYYYSVFTDFSEPMMAAYDKDDTFVFFHLGSYITFTIPGEEDFDEYRLEDNDDAATLSYTQFSARVGWQSVDDEERRDIPYASSNSTYGTLGGSKVATGSVVCDGSTVNTIYIPAGANFPNGFTLYFLKGGTEMKYARTTAAVDLRVSGKQGKFLAMGTIPSSKLHVYVPPTSHDSSIPVGSATDLGSTETANCYIVDGSDDANKEKIFKFKAVKGNSSTVVDEIKSVVVLWETYNNATSVSSKTVIAGADFDLQEGDDPYIVFQMPETLHAGNALIAAKSSGDEILWSWHIWVPSSTVGTSANGYGGKTQNGMMDRNLGALEVTEDNPAAAADIVSAGLMYQWGRKDPFMGPSAFGTNEPAKVSGTAKTNVTEQMTVAESIKNPTVFVAYNGDWTSETDNNFWADDSPSNKTIYDPCPAGYRVPQRNTSLTFWNSTTLSDQTDWVLDAEHYWFKVFTPAAVFPISGYIYKNGGYANSGVEAYIWSSHKGSDTAAYAKRLKSDGTTKNEQPVKATGAAVRCVAK